MTFAPPPIISPHPDWRASSPTASDCDSGAFSRCSTPGFVFDRNSEQSPLISPPLVLSVIKQSQHNYQRPKRLKLNPNLLLSCLSEAGKSSRFPSLQNLSTLHPMNTHKFQLYGSGAAEEGVRGSLPHICEGRVGGVGWSRPGSNISWWWDNEFSGEDTDTRYGGTKLQFSAPQRKTRQCDNNCDSQVTVNRQHLCSFT